MLSFKELSEKKKTNVLINPKKKDLQEKNHGEDCDCPKCEKKRRSEDVNDGPDIATEESCGKGMYYCHDDKKCKPIPKGYKEGKDGMLVAESKAVGAVVKQLARIGAKKLKSKKVKKAIYKKGKEIAKKVGSAGLEGATDAAVDRAREVGSDTVKNVGKKKKKIDEAKVDQGKDDAAKQNERNQRMFGNRRGSKGSAKHSDDTEARRYNTEKGRGVKMKGKKDKTPVNYHKRDSDKRVDALLKGMKEEVGIATHSMMMKDKAKKEAMLRKKERDAVAKKLRKEERDEYGDPVGGPKISKKQKEKNLKANTPDEQHTTTTSEGYGSDRVGPALKVARVIDRVNPRPKPNSKRTRVSRALKLASIKKDEKIRKREENPYSADKRLKMVATSIRDRVKQKARAITAREDYIPEEGYDIARDMGRVKPSKDKKDGTTMPPSAEMKKTQKVNKGPSAFDRVKKKYGKAVMVVGKK